MTDILAFPPQQFIPISPQELDLRQFRTVFDAVADAAAYRVDQTQNVVQVASWAGGSNPVYAPALYGRVAGNPGHALAYQDPDGQWWEILERAIDVKMVGAVGDYANRVDDLQAFARALGPGRPVLLPKGEFYLSSRWILSANFRDVRGTGQFSTTLYFGATSRSAIEVRGRSAYLEGFTISATDERNAAAYTRDRCGILVGGVDSAENLSQSTFRDINILRQPGDGFKMNREAANTLLESVYAVGNRGHGFSFENGQELGQDESRPGIITMNSCRAVENGGNALACGFTTNNTIYRLDISEFEVFDNAWNETIPGLLNAQFYLCVQNFFMRSSALGGGQGYANTVQANGDSRYAKSGPGVGIYIEPGTNNFEIRNHRWIYLDKAMSVAGPANGFRIEGNYFGNLPHPAMDVAFDFDATSQDIYIDVCTGLTGETFDPDRPTHIVNYECGGANIRLDGIEYVSKPNSYDLILADMAKARPSGWPTSVALRPVVDYLSDVPAFPEAESGTANVTSRVQSYWDDQAGNGKENTRLPFGSGRHVFGGVVLDAINYEQENNITIGGPGLSSKLVNPTTGPMFLVQGGTGSFSMVVKDFWAGTTNAQNNAHQSLLRVDPNPYYRPTAPATPLYSTAVDFKAYGLWVNGMARGFEGPFVSANFSNLMFDYMQDGAFICETKEWRKNIVANSHFYKTKDWGIWIDGKLTASGASTTQTMRNEGQSAGHSVIGSSSIFDQHFDATPSVQQVHIGLDTMDNIVVANGSVFNGKTPLVADTDSYDCVRMLSVDNASVGPFTASFYNRGAYFDGITNSRIECVINRGNLFASATAGALTIKNFANLTVVATIRDSGGIGAWIEGGENSTFILNVTRAQLSGIRCTRVRNCTFIINVKDCNLANDTVDYFGFLLTGTSEFNSSGNTIIATGTLTDPSAGQRWHVGLGVFARNNQVIGGYLDTGRTGYGQFLDTDQVNTISLVSGVASDTTVHAGYRSGKWYAPPCVSRTSLTMAADTLYAVKVSVHRRMTVSALAVHVTSAVAATNIKAALYRNDRSGVPGERIGSTAPVSSAATGTMTAALAEGAITIKPGVYWLAMISNGAPGVAAISASDTAAIEDIGGDTAASVLTGSAGPVGFTGVSTYTAGCPATFGTATTRNAATPLVALQAA